MSCVSHAHAIQDSASATGLILEAWEAFARPCPFGKVKMASNERVALDAGDSSSCDSTASVWPHLALYFSILAWKGGASRVVTFAVM